MSQNKTVGEILRESKLFLKECKIETYALDAELLLMQVAGLTKIQLFTQDHRFLTEEELAHYQSLLEKRKKGTPTQYLLGHCEFMGLDFLVKEGVLIPRPDTEILVEVVLEIGEREGFHTLLDMGTGTGCIPISLAHHGRFSTYGVDISPVALEIAKANGERNSIEVKWVQSNLFENVPRTLVGNLDGLVSNPPYIPTKDLAGLMTEVKDFEPRLALDGGIDGLDFYRKIIEKSKPYLKEHGWIFFEIGYNQAQDLIELFSKAGFEKIEVRQDLAGLDRVVLARRK